MLAIRFARTGRKNAPQFKVVLQEHTVAPGGRHVAVLGSYDPKRKVAVLKADKIKEWIAKERRLLIAPIICLSEKELLTARNAR